MPTTTRALFKVVLLTFFIISTNLGISASLAADCAKIALKNPMASHYSSGYPPQNTVDQNPNTRWTAYGKGSWVMYDLGATEKVCSVSIAWHRGNVRLNNFDIWTWNDNDAEFKRVKSFVSSGKTLSPETYTFSTPITARRIAIVVNGNNENDFASINEVSMTVLNKPMDTGCNAVVIKEAFASGNQAAHPASHAIDKNLSTYWAQQGWGWIIADLGADQTVCGIAAAWLNGNTRSYNFDIWIAESNAKDFTTVSSNNYSSGTTTAPEQYRITPVKARYVAVTVNGNSKDTLAAISELSVFAKTAAPADTTAPSVTIKYPTSQSSIKAGTIVITGAAADNAGGSGVKTVQVKIDNGGFVDATPKAPGDWSAWSYTTTISVVGKHQLVAKATDKANRATTTAPLEFNITKDVTAPAGTISYPTPNRFVRIGAITLKGTAQDNAGGSGVKSVEVSLDNTPYKIATPKAAEDWSAWTFATTVLEGKHIASVRLTDRTGNISLLTVSFTADQTVDFPLGYEDARHLLFRTSFAASEAQVQAFAKLTRAQGVKKLLDGVRTTPLSGAPDWALLPLPDTKGLTPEQLDALTKTKQAHRAELPRWWYKEMITTSSPFTEKMVLFWHNHFTSNLRKVWETELMYRQNAIFRTHALGNFGTMLHEVSKSPAMIIYLDGTSNRKTQPNENFAREVMELFTLGEGKYTQKDISEAARAFTGWTITPVTKDFTFNQALHDTGSKTILGRTGNFDGDAVLDILLAQPATAEYITAKFWKEFISPTPNANEVKRLAAIFRDSKYSIRALMQALLTSDYFYTISNQSVLTKSPVELMVGTVRQFNLHLTDLQPLVNAGRQSAQEIFYPPSVAGWAGGEAWIDSITLMARYQFIGQLFNQIKLSIHKPENGQSANMTGHELFDMDEWFAQFPGTMEQKRAQAMKLILPIKPVQKPTANAEDHLEFLRQLALDQAYQLK